MVYIHVKNVGNKKYYTLRISVRKGNKVITKDLCNLGSDLSKVNLSNLEKKYKTEIRRSYKTLKKFLDKNRYINQVKKPRKSQYFTQEQLLNIEAAKEHYNKIFLKRDKQSQSEVWESFIIHFAANTTAIEGNTISLKEANRLIKEDIIPKNKTLREVYDITNTKKTIEFLREKNPKLDLNLIEKIHDMLLENIDKRKGYRSHDIHIFGQPFEPGPAKYVKSDMQLLLSWYRRNRKMHPLALAIFFHHKFENIHPFSDGNGRTGRVLLNYILNSMGYPPIVISKRFRKQYLDSMSKADTSIKKGLLNITRKDYDPLLKFIYTQLKFSYWDTFL